MNTSLPQTLTIAALGLLVAAILIPNPLPSSSESKSNELPRPQARTIEREDLSEQPGHQPKHTDKEPDSTVSTTEESVPDLHRPTPRHTESDQSAVARIVKDHLESHPSIEIRLEHLRRLSKPGLKPRDPSDPTDFAIDMKNRLARAASEVFVEVIGPMSVEDEWQLGDKVHEQMLGEMEVDAAASERLQRLAAPILKQVKRTAGRPYTFTVVDNKQVNAFAHLGGHIYFYKGLMNVAKNDAELRFVLGHEIGHVELAHCSKASLPGAVTERAAGKLAKAPVDVLNQLVRLSYSKEDELEADAWSYRRLKAAGKSDSEILSFLYTLLRQEHRSDHKE